MLLYVSVPDGRQTSHGECSGGDVGIVQGAVFAVVGLAVRRAHRHESGVAAPPGQHRLVAVAGDLLGDVAAGGHHAHTQKHLYIEHRSNDMNHIYDKTYR